MVCFGIWYLSISSQGVGDGANANDNKTPVFLAYSYSLLSAKNILEYGMVCYTVRSPSCFWFSGRLTSE
jgi:hypothetical protein